MRIALIARRLGLSGGAEYSLHSLKGMLEEDHDVLLIGTHVGGSPFPDSTSFNTAWKDAVPEPLEPFLGTGYFGVRAFGRLVDFDPDLIVSQHQLALAGAEFANYIGCPHVLRLHAFTLLRDRTGVVERTFNWAITRICRKSDLVLANSEFTADRYRSVYDVEVDVVYPFISKDAVTVDSTGERILHVRPVERKGIAVTLSVAEKCPDREFLVIGTEPDADDITERMNALPNVNYVGYVDDVRSAYRDARAVLMPSTWEEPFGMVAVEAGLNGLPVFCSGRGGLSESVGDARFVVSSNHPDDYVSKLDEMDGTYAEFSRAARENAEELTAERQYERFTDVVSSRIGLAL